MKKIPNSKNYYVCRQGFVYKDGRRLGTNRDNYLDVSISFEDGTRKSFYVHRLVAMVYIPNPDNKPFVNHKDGNKHNNSVANLEWVTAQENTLHAVATGLIGSGCEAPNARLSVDTVHSICKMLAEGRRVKDVKDRFKVSQATVSMIKAKKQYTEIANQYEFPIKKRAISDATAIWVCNLLQAGKRHKEILSLYTGDRLDVKIIDSILHRKAYKDISINFEF